MYIVFISSLIALFLTWQESIGRLKGGMKIGFFLVTFLGVIHYDYGNDYLAYYKLFESCTSIPFDLNDILSREVYKEPGWVLLCWMFKYLGGFFMMVAVLNIVQNVIIYKFIAREVDVKWWPMAVFIYLFSTNLYLMSFSMMRQEFVTIVFLGMWRYIKECKWWIPLIVLYVCSFVHSSAMVLLPFSFWGFFPVNKGKMIGITYVILLLSLWFFKDTLNSVFKYSLTLDESFSAYADTYGDDDNSMHIGLGFAMNMIPFVLSILFLSSKQYPESQRKLVAMAALSFLITPFGQIIPIVGRISMYFLIYNLGAIPLIYNNLKDNLIRYGLVAIYCLMILYDYYIFYHSEVWIDKYTTFHTIFSQIL